MKSNIVIFWILTAYMVILATVYTGWNVMLHGRPEWVGSVAILLSGGLTGFIAFYLGLVQRKQGGVLVEDLEDADIDDGDPELGEFSPWSWWPLVLAFGSSLVVLGLCVGFDFWLSFLALPVVLVSIVGWVYEYYRGHFAR
ncbi:cytochrome c oxidase subunit 4 [Leucobacter ruminantium]|uniref:Cytochrome c oxidase polypeptide 4 n=1 Tax=Leucobacter ruminantium TaxID=1289170 RepID=A0A939LXG1_9MICO|nr:cytochrome c oxidase subunit 4 [Leucobacter ruminantium]MBO1806247.1 cytochrome c oxidase subunit 4 [Leucobacter ruminantium]